MGKGSGGCSRPALTIGSSDAPNRLQDAPTDLNGAPTTARELQRALRGMDGLERLLALHRWAPPSAAGEALPDEETAVASELAEGDDRIERYVEASVLGTSWQSELLERIARAEDPECRALVEEVERLSESIDALERELDTESSDHHQRSVELERELREQLMLTHRDLSKHLATRYGTFEPEYVPGEADLTERFAAHLAEHAAEMDRIRAEAVASLTDLSRRLHRLNAGSVVEPIVPNWQPQRIETLEAALDERERAIVLTGGLLRDDVAYLSRRRERQRVDGRMLRTESGLGDMVAERLPDVKLGSLRYRLSADVFTVGDRATAAEWIERLGELRGFDDLPVEDRWRVAECCAQHADYEPESEPARRFVDGPERVMLEGEVGPEDEEQLVSTLIRLGARAESNEMELPNYESQHQILPGDRFALSVAGAHIEYVPHAGAGVEMVERAEYRARIDLSDPVERRALFDRWAAHEVESAGGQTDEYFMINDQVHYGGPHNYFNQRARAKIEAGTADGGHRLASEDDLRAAGYRRFTTGWLPPEIVEPMAELESILGKLGPRAGRIEATGESDEQVRERLRWRLRDLKMNEGARRWLVRSGDWLTPNVEHRRVRRRATLTQHAPLSERGQLRVSGPDAALALEALRRVGAADAPAERVPLGLLHPGGARVSIMPPGRLAPRRDEYVAGLARIRMPAGTMVMHGMTGVSNDQTGRERLTRLIESGGILSTADRRRRGIRLRTMSPLGDMASGIDTGVPCSVQTAPRHGSYAYFALRPSVLEQRDVWFSDQDFGAGESRYDKYTDYARSIGQGRIQRSPSPTVRQRHLRTGTAGGQNHNEVYLRGGVSMHEVDTVFISASTLDACVEQVSELERLRENGALPASVRVECVNVGGSPDDDTFLLPPAQARVAKRSGPWAAQTARALGTSRAQISS